MNLIDILESHRKWLNCELGGVRAHLTRANLTRANLTHATLTRTNLTDANLTDAHLTRANLTRANLTRANLTRATLTRTNLTEAFNGKSISAKLSILPDEGDVVGWKKCHDGARAEAGAYS